MIIDQLRDVLEEAQQTFGEDLRRVWVALYDYIEQLEPAEIEEIGVDYVGSFIPVTENVNWYQNPEIKETYIKRILDDYFFDELGIDYEDYVAGSANKAVQETAATTHSAIHSKWAAKPQEDLEEMTNEQLYEVIVALDEKPAQIDKYLQDNFIKNTFRAQTIEEAVKKVEKSILIAELERLVASYREVETQHRVEAAVPLTTTLTTTEWSLWYEMHGRALYETATITAQLEAPKTIVWYEGLNLEVDDCYQLKGADALQIERSIVMICNGINGENFVGLGRLERIQRTEEAAPIDVITWDNTNLVVDMRTLQNERCALLVVEEKHAAALQQAVQMQSTFTAPIYRVGFDLKCEELAPISAPLCIDFGTTNTTLGCYLAKDYVPNMPQNAIALGYVHYDGYVKNDEKFDGVNFIHFYDEKSKKKSALDVRKNYTVPTVVYVEMINSETGDIQYKYGYEALQAVQQLKLQKTQDARRLGTLIYGLKRWIYALDEEEELVDELGNKRSVVRSDILKGYIHYILARATHQVKGRFTTLHFSTPVKMKAQFIKAFTDMFPQYDVIAASNAVDEGVAVLYDAISQEIVKNNGNVKGRALIFDCGGGTTDLANCEYEAKSMRFGGSALEISTKFVNGNPNFGGNNLTYRIMQMLKVKLAILYRGAMTSDLTAAEKQARVDNFLMEKEEAIATINEGAEEGIIEQLYKQLDQAYQKEEAYIPTQFKSYEYLSSSYVEKVRHNFYFLWDMAEAIKREFFSQLNKVVIDLDQDLQMKLGQFILYTQQVEEQLQLMDDKPQQFTFTIREIEQLIVPEIYAVEYQFLNSFKVNEFMKEGERSLIKLTGQSCRIPYFRDMLKEFIPGKLIRSSKHGVDSKKQALELKLACVRGVIHYWRDQANGMVGSVKNQEAPIVPYDVLIEAPASVADEKLMQATSNVLIEKGQMIGETVGLAVIQKSATDIVLTVRNDRKQIGEKRSIKLHQQVKTMSTSELQQLLAPKFDAYGDVLGDAELRKDYTLIFVSTNKEEWQVTLQMATLNEQGYWDVSTHEEPFEDAHAYENFFDGQH